MPDGWLESSRRLRAELTEDRRRNDSTAARLTVAIWRLGSTLNGRPGLVAFGLRRVVQILDILWTRGVVRAELPPQVRIGPGLRLPAAGRGVVVHYSCRIGSDVTLGHHATLGVRQGWVGPTLGDRVTVGPHAVALGEIHLAEGTCVGPRAVVLADTEPETAYEGVPAVATAGLP